PRPGGGLLRRRARPRRRADRLTGGSGWAAAIVRFAPMSAATDRGSRMEGGRCIPTRIATSDLRSLALHVPAPRPTAPKPQFQSARAWSTMRETGDRSRARARRCVHDNRYAKPRIVAPPEGAGVTIDHR